MTTLRSRLPSVAVVAAALILLAGLGMVRTAVPEMWPEDTWRTLGWMLVVFGGTLLPGMMLLAGLSGRDARGRDGG